MSKRWKVSELEFFTLNLLVKKVILSNVIFTEIKMWQEISHYSEYDYDNLK